MGAASCCLFEVFSSDYIKKSPVLHSLLCSKTYQCCFDAADCGNFPQQWTCEVIASQTEQLLHLQLLELVPFCNRTKLFPSVANTEEHNGFSYCLPLKISKEETLHPLLGSLCQRCVTCSTYWCSEGTSCVPVCAHCLLSWCWAPLK